MRGFGWGCVGMARFELATSWSQTRRDNRATLRPEYVRDPFLYKACSAFALEPSRFRAGRDNRPALHHEIAGRRR